jgi:hypothetical protein
VPAPELERLQRLADAFGVDPTLEAVADAIIARTTIAAGANERNAVIAVVALLVRDEGTLTVIQEAGDSGKIKEEMAEAAALHSPQMPASLVNLVIVEVFSALRWPK